MISKPFLRNFKSNLATAFNLDFLYGQRSYSQEGEDLVLAKLFAGQNQGFFIDIGAHHPYRYSNTYALYKKGWQGINVDATPGSMAAFDRTRPQDINLELAVGKAKDPQTYYLFADSAFNTLSEKTAEATEKAGQSKIVNQVQVEAMTLADLLEKHLPENQQVDLLNVDAEGNDLEILEGNNWQQYLPKVVVVEVGAENSMKAVLAGRINKLLESNNYYLYSRLFNSAVYRLSE